MTDKIEKAIQVEELQKDLADLEKGLVALRQQAIAQSGAIQYIQSKIASLTAPTAQEDAD